MTATIRHSSAGPGSSSAIVAAVYLGALLLAESVVVWNATIGMALHLAVLFALLIHSGLSWIGQRWFLVALALVPLIRVVSLSLPLTVFPPVSWFGLVGLPLLAAAAMAVWIIGPSREEIGFQLGRPSQQLAIALAGIPLGVAEFLILGRAPLRVESGWPTALMSAAVLIVFTGFMEELIFRGILQSVAMRIFNEWGIVYVSAVFAVMHIGYLSAADFGFVFLIGLGFGWVFARTRSLLGVSMAHGLTNVVLFLVMPALMS